jgi:hypothetical protein
MGISEAAFSLKISMPMLIFRPGRRPTSTVMLSSVRVSFRDPHYMISIADVRLFDLQRATEKVYTQFSPQPLTLSRSHCILSNPAAYIGLSMPRFVPPEHAVSTKI